ncbi:hypothetical protein ASJ30_06935 [Janibacter indicus]|uniref:Uncharacterized protein n=1 Tax=Janibacter indicus TaxID=857417 RepID=A0A1L3MG05_9MICO|nr:hypothetical protein ASJ30_06935 [Janibacter indicus]
MTNAVVVIVVGVNGDGQREVLDLQVDTRETGGMERVLRRPDAVQAQFKPCDAYAVMGPGYRVQMGISTETLSRGDVMR